MGCAAVGVGGGPLIENAEVVGVRIERGFTVSGKAGWEGVRERRVVRVRGCKKGKSREMGQTGLGFLDRGALPWLTHVPCSSLRGDLIVLFCH